MGRSTFVLMRGFPRYLSSMVSLRPIDDSNREALEALEVSADQQQFVSNVADSLREAAREPDGRALYWAIYANETPVGFVMISDDVGSRLLSAVPLEAVHRPAIPRPGLWHGNARSDRRVLPQATRSRGHEDERRPGEREPHRLLRG